jgi:hypothetical protein
MSKQKFKKGDLVYITDSMPDTMKHFTGGTMAVVMGSYADEYGGGEREKHIYSLFVKGEGPVAWYKEDQLTFWSHKESRSSSNRPQRS